MFFRLFFNYLSKNRKAYIFLDSKILSYKAIHILSYNNRIPEQLDIFYCKCRRAKIEESLWNKIW